jgi:hypothetical protein
MRALTPLAAGIALVLSMSVLPGAQAPASADTPTTWTNNGSLDCLYYNGGYNGNPQVYMTSFCDQPGNRWHVHRVDGTPYYRIVNTVGGACLAAFENGHAFPTQCGDGRAIDLWELRLWSGGRWTIKSERWQQCLSNRPGDATVGIANCPGGNLYQEWFRG